MAPQQEEEEIDAAIEQWKIRRLIKNLNKAQGNGTSMISLIIPPKQDLNHTNKMLTEEYGTASNIKSRVNRLSVLGAITSTQQRLKRYNGRTPNKGLIVYCGTAMTADGKEKKITIDFEPFKPINTKLYLCDNKFHTEDLSEVCGFCRGYETGENAGVENADAKCVHCSVAGNYDCIGVVSASPQTAQQLHPQPHSSSKPTTASASS